MEEQWQYKFVGKAAYVQTKHVAIGRYSLYKYKDACSAN